MEQVDKNTSKNDWDSDDNWEDWGDAEEASSPECVANVEAEKYRETSNFSQDNNTELEKKTTSIENLKALRNDSEGAQLNQEISGKSSWGLGWGGKLTSVLSTASEGLGNITSTVNQSLNQFIGVPDAEELARINVTENIAKNNESTNNKTLTEETEKQTTEEVATGPAFGINLVSGVTQLGSKVLNTGLDTLEGIGKKTMHILQENDPKLINKRKMLGLETEKPNLSALLKEAKDDADQIEQSLRQLQMEKSKAKLQFEVLFENFCGLVHLEALEILSKESQLKLQNLISSVSGNALNDLEETINEVKELLEMEDLESESDGDYEPSELNSKLLATIEDVDLNIKFDDIVNNWTLSIEWLKSSEATDESDVESVFAKSITALSETCALEMCKLHKIAELLLVKEHHSTANEVDGIVQLCKQFNGHLQGLTHRYAAILSSKTSDEAKLRVNTLFTELLVAVQQIEKAYKLFTPILQIGAV